MLWLAAMFLPTMAVAGEVVVDNSFGHGGSLTGPNFTIGAGLGKQVGSNLFQSFSTFNLDKGDVATFTGPASITNVLARVSGGSASSIDGTLKCTIPRASFYLIDSAGVVFGPDAALELKGSFAVTTANVVHLADGGKVAASVNPQDSVLTSAAPAAFGFLARSPAALTITGSTLAVAAGKSIMAVTGPVQMAGGGLSAPGGGIGIVSAASPGQVSVDSSSLTLHTVTRTALGAVALESGAAIATSGSAGGPISIQCGSLSLTGGSAIDAGTTGSGAGGAVSLKASGQVTVSDSSVVSTARTGSTGNAGALTLNTATLQLLSPLISRS